MKTDKTMPATESDINSGRRIALRNMLAAGCALCLSAAWRAEAQPEAGQAKKASKEQAKYQGTPKDGQKCSACMFFEAPESCKLVEGEISPDGWCALFTQKSS